MTKPIYEKPRPKSLGKPKKLTSAQKAKAKKVSNFNEKQFFRRYQVIG